MRESVLPLTIPYPLSPIAFPPTKLTLPDLTRMIRRPVRGWTFARQFVRKVITAGHSAVW